MSKGPVMSECGRRSHLHAGRDRRLTQRQGRVTLTRFGRAPRMRPVGHPHDVADFCGRRARTPAPQSRDQPAKPEAKRKEEEA